MSIVSPFVSVAKTVVKVTPFGKRLVEIKQGALTARSFELPVQADSFSKKFMQHANHLKASVVEHLTEGGVIPSGKVSSYVQKVNERFQGLSKVSDDVVKAATESLGVGPSKFLQIISSDDGMIKKLPEKLKKLVREARSNNITTRTFEEAQKEVVGLFAGKYTLQKQLGVGTIGEAYLAKDASGKEIVVKMIKKGINKESLSVEEEIFADMARKASAKGQSADQNEKIVRQLYADWKKEVDFAHEAANNKALSKGAQRYKVAGVVDISNDARAIVYEKAQGIQADKFVKMVKDYKENPSEYAAKYASEISENPWMSKPDTVASDFSSNFVKAFNEMMLFTKKGGKSVMHADPHTGNFFVTQAENGKFVPTFIDTGNCIERSSAQISEDLSFFTNYFVGNSQEVASYFVKRADFLPSNKSKQEVIHSVKEELNKKLFKSGCNVTDFARNQKVINSVLESQGVFLSSEASTAIKAQMQFMTTSLSLSAIAGKKGSTEVIPQLMPDVMKGMAKLALHTNPINVVKSAAVHAYKDPNSAFGTLFQMIA